MTSIIKCQKCGSSSVDVIEENLGKCSHCDSLVIIPKVEKDLQNLLNQAHLHRMNYEYEL